MLKLHPTISSEIFFRVGVKVDVTKAVRNTVSLKIGDKTDDLPCQIRAVAKLVRSMWSAGPSV